MESKSGKVHNKTDIIVVIGCVALVWCIVQFWMPAAPDDLLARKGHILLGLIGMALTFIGLSLYGVVRFSPARGRWLVLGLVALPAVYGGILLGSLRGPLPQSGMQDISGSIRVQDGLAALWWGRKVAGDLPAWSRGGVEPWPTVGGDMLVFTHEDRVQVDLSEDRSSPRECERLLSDFAGEISVMKEMDSWVVINGKRALEGDDPSGLCRNGGTMSLVAKLPIRK